MKITANAGELAAALALAASLSDDKNAKKILALAAIHLSAADDELTVTANILDRALTLTVPANIEAVGGAAVSAAKLAALAAGFPDGAAIKIASEEAIVHVGCCRSHFKLATIPFENLPPVPRLAGETGSVALAREEAATLLVRPAFAASTERTRSYIEGILLHDDGDGLAAVATDGHRLVRTYVSSASGLSDDFRLIVPNAALRIIAKLLADKSVERVTLRRSKNLFALETAKAVFVSKLIDGTFPDYRHIIPKPSSDTVTTGRTELAQALGRVAAVAADKQRRVVGLTWADGEPVLRLCLADGDAADDVILAEVVGSGRVAVQINLLTEMLEALEGKRVCLDSRSASDPILVIDPHDEDFSSLVMPCTWQPASKAA